MKDPTRKEPRVAPMTLEECAVYFGVTRERVRQIESKALKKLKADLERRGYTLDDFLGEIKND
jgi:DNA-directed RNA polymerase sigma subunit (sigma70/sigma32)